MKLNLGCGYNKLTGYVNVDHDTACEPDVVADLESALPFADNSAEEIMLYHVLEHLGRETKTYLNIWREFYRVLCPGGIVKITVPHHLHQNFFHDPTHCRIVTPTGIDMFNQERNRDTIATGGNETTLGLQVGIDIRVENVGYDLMPWFQEQMSDKQRWEIEHELNCQPNACYQVHIHARAHKE